MGQKIEENMYYSGKLFQETIRVEGFVNKLQKGKKNLAKDISATVENFHLSPVRSLFMP